MNSIDRKILRCQREIEASRPKVMSFEEFEKGDHNLAIDKTGAIREVADQRRSVWFDTSGIAGALSFPKSYEGSGAQWVVLGNSNFIEHEAAPSKATEGEWIEWKGGAGPLQSWARVEVRFNNGEQRSDRPAAGWGWASGTEAWLICAYRVIA
jgi:hypothetical protein